MTGLSPNRLALAEFKRNIHYATTEVGTPLKDVLDPTFWRHHAKILVVGSKIEVFAEDGAFYAELLVTNKIEGGVVVRELFSREFEPVAAAETEYEGHIIKHAGPIHLHQVIRKGGKGKEKVFLRDGFRTKREAMDYIDGQNKARAA